MARRAYKQQTHVKPHLRKSNLHLVEPGENFGSDNQRTKKNFHVKDMARFVPLSENQRQAQILWQQGKNLVLAGSAGTGKSLVSVWLALKEVLDTQSEYEKLIIVRSAVSSRDIGFLPGEKDEKTAVFEAPYTPIFSTVFGGLKTSYDHLKKNGIVEFESTSFLRGLTFENCIVIVDEFQNMRDEELHTIVTRVGKNCKIIFAGDTKQNDLTQKKGDVSGFSGFMQVARVMKSDFGIVEFTPDDIVRSGLCKNWIVARELLGI